MTLSTVSEQFNQHIAESPLLQEKLRLIKSPQDLIDLADEEGFVMTKADFQQLAQKTYQEWLIKLDSTTRAFFEQIHHNSELNLRLHQCQNIEDLINLADECGYEITANQINYSVEIASSIKGFSMEKLFFQNLGLI